MEAKSYTWYYITNRQRQNAASLAAIRQTQWLLSPKYSQNNTNNHGN